MQKINNNNFLALKNIFIKNLSIWPFIDTAYELRSYERGVAQLGSAGALGALGRRFESCRPDSNNPSYRQVSQPVFFFTKNNDLNGNGQIAVKLLFINYE